MKQYHVYKDNEEQLQVVETTGMETPQEISEHIAFLIGLKPNEVDYYGCMADSPEEAMREFTMWGKELSTPDKMRGLHATVDNLRARINYSREGQQQ